MIISELGEMVIEMWGRKAISSANGEEKHFFSSMFLFVQDVPRKIQLQVSKVSLASNLGGENISMIEELSNLVVEVCLYEITQGKTS